MDVQLQETVKKATNAKIVKLVEMICVETRFITQNQIKNSFEFTTLFDNVMALPEVPIAPRKRKSVSTPTQPNKVQIVPANGNLQTIQLPPQTTITSINKSDKELQVEQGDLLISAVHENFKCLNCLKNQDKIYCTVGTQYEIIEEPQIPLPKTVEVEMEDKTYDESFQAFVTAKVLTYDNDMHECLICGEVSHGLKELSAHMNLHYGPSALCTKCGRLFDHMFLMWHHRCKTNLRRRRRPGSLLCMHALCPVYKIKRKIQNKRKECKRFCQRDPYRRTGSKRWFKRIFRNKRQAMLQTKPKSPANPESVPKTAAIPEALSKSLAMPESLSKSLALPEPLDKSLALPEPLAKSLVLPEPLSKSPAMPQILTENPAMPQTLTESQDLFLNEQDSDTVSL